MSLSNSIVFLIVARYSAFFFSLSMFMNAEL